MGRRDYTLTRNDFRDHAMQTNDTGSRLTHDVCDFVQAQLGAKGSTLTWLDDAGEIAGFERGGDGRHSSHSRQPYAG